MAARFLDYNYWMCNYKFQKLFDIYIYESIEVRGFNWQLRTYINN